MASQTTAEDENGRFPSHENIPNKNEEKLTKEGARSAADAFDTMASEHFGIDKETGKRLREVLDQTTGLHSAKNAQRSVGVAFGNCSLVVASSDEVNKHAINVSVNPMSNRSTPTIMEFCARERLFGEAAEGRTTAAPENTLNLWPLMLQSSLRMEDLTTRFKYICHFRWRMESGRPRLGPEDNPLVSISSSTPEMLCASWLRWYLDYISDGHSSRGDSVCLTVPNAVTVADRHVLETMVILAGADLCAVGEDSAMKTVRHCMRPTFILNNSDALVNAWACRHLPQLYQEHEATYKRDAKPEQMMNGESNGENEEVTIPPVTVAMVDVGFAETTVQIFKVVKKLASEGEPSMDDDDVKVEIIDRRVDSTLGVHEVIAAVVDYTIEQEKIRIPNMSLNAKRSMRLFKTCERGLKDLSCIRRTNICIEGFLDEEHDINIPISRAILEQRTSEFRTRLESLFTECVTSSGVVVESMLGCEIVGGGSRIPFVQETILKVFYPTKYVEVMALADHERSEACFHTLRKTIDGNSSLSIGAAHFAAGRRYVQPLCVIDYTDEQVVQNQAVLEGLNRVIAIEKEFSKLYEARNQLESYILSMQSEMTTSTEAKHLDTAEVRKLLLDADEWLLNVEPEKAVYADYDSKLKELTTAVETAAPQYFAALKADRETAEEKLRKNAAEAAMFRDDDVDVKLPNSALIKKAIKNKDEGNDLYKDNNIELSIQRYVKSLQYAAKMFDESPQDKDEIRRIKLACHLNLSQCYIKFDNEQGFKKAISACDAAIDIQPDSIKAYYRRAFSKEKLKEYDAAMSDIQAGLTITPADSDLLKLKDYVDKRLKDETQKEKKMFSKMFA